MCSIVYMPTHTIYRIKFNIWQVDIVFIEAGSPIKGGSLIQAGGRMNLAPIRSFTIYQVYGKAWVDS